MRNDVFAYNSRSELTGASLGTQSYTYDYDNIGNRKTAEEATMDIAYATNNMNQYLAITEGKKNELFLPSFDVDGNQSRVKTETDIWDVTYNVANRPVKFLQESTEVEYGYDYMGRRWFKKVKQNGVVTKHECYLYRGYLQIAALDILQNAVIRHAILWDPSEPMVTRPLALMTGGNLYLYGFDFNKNVNELLNNEGQRVVSYDYTPYGAMTTSGEYASLNFLQWSSEVWDQELGMVYYNYRYLNTRDGRWISRDILDELDGWGLYSYVKNMPTFKIDYYGLSVDFLECKKN